MSYFEAKRAGHDGDWSSNPHPNTSNTTHKLLKIAKIPLIYALIIVSTLIYFTC